MYRPLLVLALIGCDPVPDLIDADADGVSASEDCNDDDPAVFPGAIERCDDVDNNCDGAIDEGVRGEVWIDADGDGFGDDTIGSSDACLTSTGQATHGGDCNDDDGDTHPGAVEVCGSGTDEDCNPASSCDNTCLSAVDFSLCGTFATGPAPLLAWSYDSVAATQVLDDGTSGLAGTLRGAPAFVPGLVGDAAHFDGASWVEGASALVLPTGTWTYVTWARVAVAADNAGPFHFLMTNGNGLPNYSGAQMFLADGLTAGGYTEIGGDPSGETVFYGADVCEGGWTQVALTFDNGAADVWVDGLAHATTVTTPDIGWGAQPFAVANDPNNLARTFLGDLDESRVYDTPFTARQLEALRMEALCPEASLPDR